MTIPPASIDDRIAIEFISGLGMPPVEFIALVAGLGCRRLGLALAPIVRHDRAYRDWSLRDDAGLRRDTIAALDDHDVTVSLGEGFIAGRETDTSGFEPDLDLMRELGAGTVNMLVHGDDRARAFDQCAAFAALAAERGMRSTIEFLPIMPPVADLPTALAAARHVESPGFGVLVDAMHLFRSGSTAADLAAADPALLGYAQLCDVPLASRGAGYADEARYDRLPPGEGELPLADLIAALPADMTIGLEVPMMARAKAGHPLCDNLDAAVAATRALLAR